MTWAARYSRTEQPELTIYRHGLEVERVNLEDARAWLAGTDLDYASKVSLREQIDARMGPPECSFPSCVMHAVDGDSCWGHGGSDPL